MDATYNHYPASLVLCVVWGECVCAPVLLSNNPISVCLITVQRDLRVCVGGGGVMMLTGGGGLGGHYVSGQLAH